MVAFRTLTFVFLAVVGASDTDLVAKVVIAYISGKDRGARDRRAQ